MNFAKGKDQWDPVSSEHPCPICGKADNCCIAKNRSAAFCGRISEGSVGKPNYGGQWRHVLRGRSEFRPVEPVVFKPARKSKDFIKVAELCHKFALPHLYKLEQALGPSVEAWQRLETGVDGVPWTHPEYNAEHQCIGITRRFEDGSKKQMSGGQRGIIFAKDYLRDPGVVLCPEGASGTAALMTMRIATVGRPNNSGGAILLAELFELDEDAIRERGLLLIADRDPKPDLSCPGWKGAESVARTLSEYLRCTIGVSFPPDNVKDSRDWYLKHQETASIDTLRQRFLDGLEITYFHPPVIAEKCPEPDPEISLRDAREQMQAARAEVIGKPCVCLDRTECGAGKTTADLHASTTAIDRNIRVLFILPTHGNCEEVEEEAIALGLNAAAYPKRNTRGNPLKGIIQNCWNEDADTCEAMGLPVVAAVCACCEHQHSCTTDGYLSGLIMAAKADLAIATHCRGRVQGPDELAQGRGYIAVHEDSRELLKPTEVSEADELESAKSFTDAASNDPRFLNSSWFTGDADPPADPTKADTDG
jgi:hypothetical protein